MNLKERALTERESDLADAATLADKEHSNRFLSALFGARERLAKPARALFLVLRCSCVHPPPADACHRVRRVRQRAGRIAEEPEGLFTSHALVVEGTARLVGQFAMWFGRTRSPALVGTVRYLLRALRTPGAAQPTAEAFRNLCARCGDALADPQVLGPLIQQAPACFPPPPPPPPAGREEEEQEDHRQPLVEGLARVASKLPAREAAAAAAELVVRSPAVFLFHPSESSTLPPRLCDSLGVPAAALLTRGDPPLATQRPILERAQQAAASAGPSSAAAAAAAAAPPPAAAYALASELRLLASAVRFLEGSADCPSGPDGHTRTPAMALLEHSWGVVGAVGDHPAWRASRPVVAALCELYKRALLSAKAASAPLLPPMLASLGAAFEAHQHPECLDALATAVEVFSGTGGALPPGTSGVLDPQAAAALAAALERAVAATHVRLAAAQAAGGKPAEHAELLRGVFELGNRFLLFASPQILRSQAPAAMAQLAAATLGLQEREPVTAAAAFTANLISPGRQMAAAGELWRSCRPQIDAIAAQHGAALVSAALAAAAYTCPRSSMRQVGALLFALLNAYPDATAQSLAAAVQSPEFPNPALGAARLTDEAKRLFLAAALRAPPARLPQARFEALVADFAQVCRREAGEDALLAYQV